MEINVSELGAEIGRVRPKVERLFGKGNIELLTRKKSRLAVIGSRKMTQLGFTVVKEWIPVLVRFGVVVVSGFMYGVDQTAHECCVDNGGETIAVLGWGVDKKLGYRDSLLYHKLIENNGLIVSEYEGERRAEKWTFPQRDRIVVGISQAVLVVEAGLDSGSMWTAKMAVRQGKKLLAVSLSDSGQVSEGVSELIQNGLAKPVISPEEVLKEMGLS